MDFFGIGFGEILLILIIALIVLGPGKVPEMARTLGKIVRALRKATTDLTTAVTKEIETEEKTHLPQLPASSGDKTKQLSDASTAEPPDTGATSPKE